MLRKIFISFLAAAAAACTLAFAGCGLFGESEQTDSTYYYIQYNDGVNRTIEVQNGDLYTLERIPQKVGYDFLGLFNAEEGGVKFVDSNGQCTMPFSGTANLILYPQFEAKTFTFVFDYRDEDSVNYTASVSYGETLPQPPLRDVYGKRFTGWRTSGGREISAETVMDFDNFSPSSFSDNKITLYADYSDIYYNVRQYVGDTLVYEQSVVCGTSLKDVLVTELNDGRVIAEWSKSENGYPIRETAVEEDLTLYAVKIGYIITFDSDGGNAQAQKIGYGGQSAELPIPQKDYHRFMGWCFEGNNIGTYFRMPDKHVTLTAQWERTHYKVSIISSADSSNLSETYVPYGGEYTFKLPTVTGYDCVGIFDAAGTECTGTHVFEEDQVFTARLYARNYEVIYNFSGGVTSDNVNSVTVTYNSAYNFVVPSRSGYVFAGWYTSETGGMQLTDYRGVGVSSWKNPSNLTVYARWISATAKFSEYTVRKITDSGVEKQHYDTVDIAGLLGRSLSEYRALGCTTVSFSFKLDIQEINDGYQAMGISNNHGTWSGYLWRDYDIEHGGGRKDGSRGSHYFSCTISINDLRDIIYILYSAHGSLDDDWNRCSIDVDISVT